MTHETAGRYGHVPVTPETVEQAIDIHGFRGNLTTDEATELKGIITTSGAEAAKAAMVEKLTKYVEAEDAKKLQ